MEIEERPIDAVKPYANNPRLNDAGVEAVANSIRRFGFRQPIMGDHEWCFFGWVIDQTFKAQHKKGFYGWREGAGHRFYGPANVPDVWQIKKVNPQSMVHLTEKPVELAVRAMEYSSRPGEHVLDLFGGSGSTLIAAEKTGRRAYLMELDPAYCDVIVERWQKFTGLKATRHPGEATTTPEAA